LIIKC